MLTTSASQHFKAQQAQQDAITLAVHFCVQPRALVKNCILVFGALQDVAAQADGAHARRGTRRGRRAGPVVVVMCDAP